MPVFQIGTRLESVTASRSEPGLRIGAREHLVLAVAGPPIPYYMRDSVRH